MINAPLLFPPPQTPSSLAGQHLTPAERAASSSSKEKKNTTYHSSIAWIGGGGSAAVLDRRYDTRRPASKESTASQRTVPATAGNNSSSSSLTTTHTNSTNYAGSNAPPKKIADEEAMRRPYKIQWGRKYLSDPQSYYPLPFDLSEMHRQILRTMLLVNVFGGPLCSPLWRTKPPKRVLEVGCGNAYWSALCHKHFARLGHSVHFTGIDIAPVSSDMRAEGMKWRFVQHDLRKVPIPFKDEEFDIIMVKDLALISSALNLTANLMEEYFRCLKPGGQMEVWDGDSTVRLLTAHVGNTQDSENEDDDQAQAEGTGTYVLTPQTPFKDAQNPYIAEYNIWVTKALEKRGFTTMPCTLMGVLLMQEPQLGEVCTRRIAVPFSEVRWEKTDTDEKRVLTAGQAALRQTALLTFVMYIESLSPYLREASGKTQDEWDRWYRDMMEDLLVKGGTMAGECHEIGAWWATKKGEKVKKKGNALIAAAMKRKKEEELKKVGSVAAENKPSPYPAEEKEPPVPQLPGMEWSAFPPPSKGG